MQSRYYDPAMGRFINADALVSTGQGPLGNNMFAYCLNNPVMFKDYLGFAPIPVTMPNTLRIDADLHGMLGTYSELRKQTKGQPQYEVHHLVEKRFYNVPGIGVYKDNPNNAPSVVLYKQEHKKYTSNARKSFQYGKDYKLLTTTAVKKYYENEYGAHQDWLHLIMSCFN